MPARRSSAVAAADPTPTLSRRHAAGAPSARGVLFTLLGEFVLPGGGTARTSAVLAAFARLGIEEKTTRQALMLHDVLTRQVKLVHAGRRFPSVDPVLPRELLPARWSGLDAARLFADQHQRWSSDAT